MQVSLWLDAIPSIAAEVAAPLSQVNQITMVGNPNDEESCGPARITGEVLKIVEKMPDVVHQMTGHRMKSM